MKDISLRQAALIAGIGLLLMVFLAPFANFYIFPKLVVAGDAVKTTENIIASQGMFRLDICCLLIVAILDIIIAWALYVLLKPVNKSLSLLSAWFRVVYAALFIAAINNLSNVLELIKGADYLNVLETDQLQTQVMVFINAFSNGWNLAMVIFGLHLLVLGYLVIKSDYIHWILGVLVMIAGLGYAVDWVGKFLVPAYNITLSTYTFIGELLLMVWLIWRGIKGFNKEIEIQ